MGTRPKPHLRRTYSKIRNPLFVSNIVVPSKQGEIRSKNNGRKDKP
jgi:hypothetical protein